MRFVAQVLLLLVIGICTGHAFQQRPTGGSASAGCLNGYSDPATVPLACPGRSAGKPIQPTL